MIYSFGLLGLICDTTFNWYLVEVVVGFIEYYGCIGDWAVLPIG